MNPPFRSKPPLKFLGRPEFPENLLKQRILAVFQNLKSSDQTGQRNCLSELGDTDNEPRHFSRFRFPAA
jgi:hypothetical protein